MLNSVWLDDKYINTLSFRLERFKRVDSYTYNFRCPFCGDSKKNKYKARGYVFPNKENTSLVFKCHNCGESISVKKFIQQIDEELYKKYVLEVLRENHTPKKNKYKTLMNKVTVHRKDRFEPLKKLRKISQLNDDNPVKRYVLDRQIPNKFHHEIYYVKRFMEWINTVISDKFNDSQLKMDEPRLVFPFIDERGRVFGVTGRSFKKNSLRYITIMFDDEHAKIYGLNRVNKNKKVYVVEGPIDSFFLNNAIALAGADGDIDHLGIKNKVIVYDNEPRNADIIKRNEKMISNGQTVCIWPETIVDKDINEMVLHGMTVSDIENIINKNTYSGLTAKIKLSQWRKI